MYERILVPLDGSEAAEGALPHAREIARKFGSRLYLLRVVEPLFVPPMPTFAGPQLSAREHPGDTEAAGEYLDGWVRVLTGEGIAAEALVRHGPPSDEILDCLEELNIGLVIIAAEDHTGLAVFFGGHTSEAILARSQVPILVVPVGWSAEEGGTGFERGQGERVR